MHSKTQRKRLQGPSLNSLAQADMIAELLFKPSDLIELYAVVDGRTDEKLRMTTPADGLSDAASDFAEENIEKVEGIRFGFHPVGPEAADWPHYGSRVVCLPGVPPIGTSSPEGIEAHDVLPRPNVVVHRGMLTDLYWSVNELIDYQRFGALTGALAYMLLNGPGFYDPTARSYLVDLPGFTLPAGGDGAVQVDPCHNESCPLNEIITAIHTWGEHRGDEYITQAFRIVQ